MLAFRRRSEAIAPAPMEDPARAGCCTTAEMIPPKALPACKPPKALAALLDKLEQTAAQTLATYSPTHLKSSPPMRMKQTLSPISQAGRRQQQQLRLPRHVQQDVQALTMAFIRQQHEKTGSQFENWKPYRISKSPPKSPILLQDVPAVDASELQQALQGGALPPVKPPVKPSRRSPLAKALRAKQRSEVPSLEDLELKQRRDGEMASYAWSYLVLPGPTWVVDQAPSFEYVLRKYYRTASSEVIEAMLQSGEPLMEEAISKAWKSEMREHRSEAIRQAFVTGDADSDGGLCLTEFREVVALHRGKRRPSRSVSASHGRMDAAEQDELTSIFCAADRDGNGILDFDEFLELVSSQAELRRDFEKIVQLGCARRQLLGHKRTGLVFRTAISPSTHSVISPSGRRRRPSLFDLRPVHEGETTGT